MVLKYIHDIVRNFFSEATMILFNVARQYLYHFERGPAGKFEQIIIFFSTLKFALKVRLKLNKFYITIVQVTEHKKTNKMVFV